MLRRYGIAIAVAGLALTGLVSVGAGSATAAPVAADTFARAVSGGWGSADTGGAWTQYGSASNFTVTGAVGQIKMAAAGSGSTVYLNSVSIRDADATVDMAVDKAPAGGAVYLAASLRRSAGGEYFAQVRWLVGGSVALDLVRIAGGVQTTMKSVTVSGLTVGVGEALRLRFQAIGASPTTLNAKVWKVGTTEPANWQNTTSDSATALQSSGAVGIRAYLAGAATNPPVTASFDNLVVSPGGGTGNQPPTAKITASSNGLLGSFDGSGSTDPDGAVASYSWDFGDGTQAGTGAVTSHSYASPGTFAVTLTVTDDKGAVGSTTRHVLVSAADAVPRPDHVVILMEENHSEQNIIGNPDAPYINALASSGANMTQSFAVAHPSQPNYLALFSGDTQGVQDDSCPHTFTTTSLYDQLVTAGSTFTGYSESLPSAGYTGCQSGNYARKHSPWVNWGSVPASANLPFTAFPAGDFDSLPQVAWVTPNLQDDMHDGTVAQGDAWLQSNLGPYIAWANTHNSVFVLTFDEDDNTQNNQIATVITGEHVAPGNYGENINHYSVLRTVEDAFGLGSLANSVSAAPISDIWRAGSNQPPTAAFTWTANGVVALFDGSGSADPDGAITSYSWDFGDASPAGSGSSPSHTYAVGGTYSVTLTVTDNFGATGSVSHDVTLNAPTALDGFERSVSGGWGTAEVGGVWTRYGTDSNFAVTAGVGRIKMASPGTGSTTYLNAVSKRDVDAMVDIALDKAPTGGPVYMALSARRSSGGEYFAQARWMPGGQVNLDLVRIVAGVQTTLRSVTVNGLSAGVGDTLRLRLQAVGADATALNAKVWKVGTSEPAGWQISATDNSAALQGAGAVGVRVYLGGAATNAPVTANFDNLSVN